MQGIRAQCSCQTPSRKRSSVARRQSGEAGLSWLSTACGLASGNCSLRDWTLEDYITERGPGGESLSRGYLLVRADGKPYGLPLARVVEVGDLGEVLDVPRALPAMRGLTPLRGRLVPLVHLGALLGQRPAPPERGRAVVVVDLGTGGEGGVRRVAL